MHRTCRALEIFALMFITLAVAAMVLPACTWDRRHHQNAKQSSSLNNLKQLAIGAMSYAQDYGETFPGWVRNPDGRYAHNVWDELINPSIKSNRVFTNKDRGFRSMSDPSKQRVITYGLNGYLICTPKGFDGSVQRQLTAHEAADNPPAPLSTAAVSDPADTILFAELATEQPVSAVFQSANWPVVKDAVANGSERWNAALTHWIDISPREWVETPVIAGAPAGSTAYDHKGWDPTKGIARDMYGGGGNYAFVDGHVKFQKLGQTVGLGKVVDLKGGSSYTVAAGIGNVWRADNTHNQWNPHR